MKTFNSILEICWLFISSWTRRQGNISCVFVSLALLNSQKALQNSLIFLAVNKSENKDAEKFNDALVGMLMAQRQISVANAAKHALEEKDAKHCLDYALLVSA